MKLVERIGIRQLFQRRFQPIVIPGLLGPAFLMEKLRESLCSSLRSSDIYTRYSSCQFLAMLPGAALENMNIITTRIQNSFRVRVPDREDLLLSFSFYPLQPLQKDKRSTNKET